MLELERKLLVDLQCEERGFEMESPELLANHERVSHVEYHIVSIEELIATLPPELQENTIQYALHECFHRELAALWRSVRDARCKLPVIELRAWRTAGSQMICEFVSVDRSVRLGYEINFHGQITSQWSNSETGWHGHQGAIVIDKLSGEISTHH